MEWFCSRQELGRSKRKTRAAMILFGILCFLTLLLFIAECLLTRTANAAFMLRLAYFTVIPLGWLLIVWYSAFLRPARLRAGHLEGLLSREPVSLEGRFSVAGRSFQIPRSVRVCPVLLESKGETRSLSLDERWLRRAPENGSLVRVQAVGKFIIGMEVLEKSAGPSGPSPRPSRVRGILRKVFSLVPALVLWAMLVLIFAGFVFNRITDTSPMYKITVFADCELENGAELAAALEEAVPPPVRMVKVHPFSFAMGDSSALRNADRYIVPASRIAEYREWFAPLPEELADRGSPDVPGGIPVYDPASGLSTAGRYFRYADGSGASESYWLFFGAGSPHLSGTDRTAVDAARALLDTP